MTHVGNANRIVTLTTDFGDADSYVAEVKASFWGHFANLQHCSTSSCSAPIGDESPGGQTATLQPVHLSNWQSDPILIDVTHSVPPFDVAAASEIARTLCSSPVFPGGSVHIMVVDPGVGSQRRALAMFSKGQYFVGPDNGIFSAIISDAEMIVEISASFRRSTGGSEPSATFDGRDLFAPAAARIVAGLFRSPNFSLADIGRPVTDPVKLPHPFYEKTLDTIQGAVISIDRFGNMRTNIRAEDVAANALIRVANVEQARQMRLRRSYSEVEKGELIALVSSDGSIEIAAREASASALLGAVIGTRVIMEW